MFLFIFPFFCAVYSFIFISCFNLLSPSSMLSVPSKGVVHSEQSLQFIKINRACSSGWLFLASECPWFTLRVLGAHDWVHYKLVTMSLMAQMPWEYFRTWAWCLGSKRNASITLTTGLWLWMGDAEPERAACLKLHSLCQKKNRILAVSGKEGDPGSPWQKWSSESEAGREAVPQNWEQHAILPWITKSIVQERRWQCAFLVSRASPGGHGRQVTVQFVDLHAFVNTEHTDNPLHISWRAQMLNSPSHSALLWKRKTHHNWQSISSCYPSFLFWQRP